MATQSFFKSVNIKTSEQANRFVTALENAEQFSRDEKISTTRTAYEVKREDVRKFVNNPTHKCGGFSSPD